MGRHGNPRAKPERDSAKSKVPVLPEGCTLAELTKRIKELELCNAVLEESLRVFKPGALPT